MKLTISTLIVALLASTCWIAFGQEERGGQRGQRGGSERILILKALDKDGDGELSASEIKNATAALLTCDKDKDGKLSADEIMASRGGAGGRRGGSGGGGERQRPKRPSSDS